MGQKRRHAIKPVFVSPTLERQWEEALKARPADNARGALDAWNREHSMLIADYQAAVERGQRMQKQEATTRKKRRHRIAAAVIGALLAIGGVAYWATRPSEDEVRWTEAKQRAAACNVNYEQAHHLKIVSKQIDLLHDGEGGWLELSYPPDAPPVGGVALTPAELEAGKTGQAQVDRESYVFDTSAGMGALALVERKDGQLVVTLLTLAGSFGDLPHAPLRAVTAAPVTVRGEIVARGCY
jgi:hypothetical protein